MTTSENNMEITDSPISFESLRKLNIIAMALHLVQGLLMLVIGLSMLDFRAELYTIYLEFVPGEGLVLGTPKTFFVLTNISPLISSFLLLSAIAHFIIAFPLRESYERNLTKKTNPIRWAEYALSSSVMIAFIAILFGFYDFWLLVSIFVLNAIMNMEGWQMEKLNQYTDKVDWTPYLIGVLAGIVPWIIFTSVFFFAPASPPDFVFFIFLTQFLMFFFGFAANMLLQYLKVGPWKDYLFGERNYIFLSLVAKTLLAWFVFFGLFQP